MTPLMSDLHAQAPGARALGRRIGYRLVMAWVAGLLGYFCPAVQAQSEDRLHVDAGVETEHHSNVFKLAPQTDPGPIFGGSQRSDTLTRGFVGAAWDDTIGLQRLRADARFEPTHFAAYNRFDYLGYTGGLSLEWTDGAHLFGTASLRASQGLTSFLYLSGVGDRNLERRETAAALIGYRLSQDGSVFFAMDRSQLSNSLTYFQAANATADAAEIGARLEREATQTSLVVRHVRGVYEADQTVDFSGAPLPVPINNDYRQDALLARLQWRPSQDSRLWGEVGYTERRYPVLSSRSFRGPTAQLGLEFKPGGALSLRADLIRDIGVPDVLSFNYVDVTELRLAPTWALTGKTAINARLSYARLSYRGDPSGIYGALRDDRLAVAGLGLAYELSRSVRASLELRHEHRTSSFDAFTFTDRVVMFGIAARF